MSSGPKFIRGNEIWRKIYKCLSQGYILQWKNKQN